MEISIIKEEKDKIQLQVAGEGHTLCNVLRSELWNDESTASSSYYLSHPIIGKPVIQVVSNKGKPIKLLMDAAESIKKKNNELRNLLKKL